MNFRKLDNLDLSSYGKMLMNQFRGGRVYSPPLNIPLMKFEIICFCPWWKKFIWGGIKGRPKDQSLFLAIIRHSTPNLCVMPQGQTFFKWGHKIFAPFRRDYAPNENNSALLNGIAPDKNTLIIKHYKWVILWYTYSIYILHYN